MRITCPECAAGFDVPDGAITEKGRKLRCSQCKHQWHQMPVIEEAPEPEPEPIPEPAEEDAAPAEEGDGFEDATEDPAPGEEQADDGGDHGFSMFGTGDGDPGADLEDDEDDFDEPPIPRRAAFGGRASTEKPRRPILLFVLLGLLILIPGVTLGARAPLVGLVPAMSPLFDAIGLHVPVPGESLIIQNVGAWRKVEGGVEVMLIQGEIHNPTQTMQSVPVLRGTIEDEAGRALESAPYSPEATILVPGDTLTFHYEIPGPDPQAARVTVTFSDEARQGGLGY